MPTAGTSLFDEKPPAGLLVAQAVGITASTFLFGQNAAISYAFVPAILQAPAPLAARQWKIVFDIGHRIGPALAITSALATGYIAYSQNPSSFSFKLNLAATLLLPGIIPFTVAFIAPTNRKLDERIEALASSAELKVEGSETETETTHALIDRWATLNLARAGIIGLGAVLAVWAAVDKREGVGFGFGTGADRLGYKE